MGRLLDRLTGKHALTVEKKGVHHGRVWRDDVYGMWRYRCLDCDYGASSRMDELVRSVAWPWLVHCANEHANPEHWSRRRGY